MKKLGLLICLGLCGCQTYPAAQDVYYKETSSVPYNQPAVLHSSQVTAPVTYIIPESQTIYVTEQTPTTQVIYVEEPVYIEPPFMPIPPHPHMPPHHLNLDTIQCRRIGDIQNHKICNKYKNSATIF